MLEALLLGANASSAKKLQERLKKAGISTHAVAPDALEGVVRSSKDPDYILFAAPTDGDADDIVVLKVIRRHANVRTVEGGYY